MTSDREGPDEPAPHDGEMSGEWIAEYHIDESTTVRFRHVHPDDAELIAEAISTASPETILHRFFTLIDGVPPRRLREMLTIDRSREACIVGAMRDGDRTRIICGARYIRGEPPERAEIAITVHDDVQHRGLGTFMLRTLTDLARQEGVREFEAWVLPSNVAMLRLLRKMFPDQQRHFGGDVVRVRAPLEQNSNSLPGPSGQ